MVVAYPLLDPDPAQDEQTGISESDIVGDLATAALYWQFDDGGTMDTADGSIGFRVRLAAESQAQGFGAFFVIGIDADLDGAIDIFVGVANRGNPDAIAIFDPGTGANTGPSTTSLMTPALQTFVETSLNYDWSPVTDTIDPGVTTLDFDMQGDNDYFLTFVVSFNAIVTELAATGITLTDETQLQFIAATSNQANALNQDLGGIDGGINSSATWAALGGFSEVITASGLFTPEPGTGWLLTSGLLGLAAARRRRRIRPRQLRRKPRSENRQASDDQGSVTSTNAQFCDSWDGE